MHGVLTPQHLHRLGLLTDAELADDRTAFVLLFQQALAKIPELPYALALDKYRWAIFRNPKRYERNLNRFYWRLNGKYRGIRPPVDRNDERYFDAGAKFHVPDNTPYIRY